MEPKLTEIKVLRDPVYNYVVVEDALIWNLIDTVEFQRLRRIHQLGGSFIVYHSAEHSRFAHSLGVYELARRTINEVVGLKDILSDYEQIAVKCAALLHDVGHGPFSHAFESVTGVSHEDFSQRIILEQTEINRLLNDYHPQLAQTVADIIAHRHSRSLLTQIISSQVDVDRMDYLLRDSYFTGVSYGSFDLGRILRTMRIKDDKLVFKASGIHALEDYFMARYQMYWQVYYHPVSRSFEMMLVKWFSALCNYFKDYELEANKLAPLLKPFVSNKEVSIKEYLMLDEQSVIHYFKVMANDCSYSILKDLSNRLLNRKLFENIAYSSNSYNEILKQVQANGFDCDYYVGLDQFSQRPYIPYNDENEQDAVWIDDGVKLIELSKASEIVKSVSKAKLKEDKQIFFVKER